MKSFRLIKLAAMIQIIIWLAVQSLYAQRIPHIPFKTPHDWWDSQVHGRGNDLWDDSAFFYPQIARMGATHAHEYHQQDYDDHRARLDSSNLGLYALPDASGDTFSVYQAMFRQWKFDEPFWNNGGSIWESDFFRLDTNAGAAVRDTNRLPPPILYIRCVAGTHNAGYMFENETLMPHLGGRQCKYGLWMRVLKDSALADATPVCSLRVTDPGLGGNAIDTTFLIRASNLQQAAWTWVGGFINKPFKRGVDTRVSLYWNGLVTASFDSLRFLDEFTYHLDYDPNKALYWGACSTKFRAIQQDFGNDSRRLSGFMVDEPGYTTYLKFGQFRDTIAYWLGNPQIETTAISGFLKPYMTRRYLDETGVPQNILDSYPLLWNTSTASSGADSLQGAWDDLIEYGPYNPPTHVDYAGLRTASEEARARDIPFWFCMQVQGSCYSAGNNNFWSREPTPAEIKCQGYLGMSFGAQGFMYYHYYSFYKSGDSGFTALPDFNWIDRPAWRGAFSRGLTDLWQSPTDSTIESEEEFDDAIGDSGILVPNQKWYAVQDFINYTRAVESFYTACSFDQSECAAEVNPVGRITIDSTYTQAGRDAPASTYLQVGLLFGPAMYAIFAEPQTFILVNRRCEDNETRIVRFHISYQFGNYQHSIRDVETGELLASGFGNSLSVVDTLGPGVGRLYFTSTNLVIHNDIGADTVWAGMAIVDNPIKVLSGVTLEIKPGTLVFFEGDGSLTVNGRLLSKGKLDSLISFTTFNGASSGLVELKGSSTDTLQYCKFIHLDKGLKVSKASSGMAKIVHCEFSHNSEEGLYVSGGDITVNGCDFTENDGDGAYLYNCKATLDSLTVSRNEKNGLYLYSVNSNSSLKHSSFAINGKGGNYYPDGNIRFFNCSPNVEKNEVVDGAEYGLYGANGSYPVLHTTTTAANTICDNASHETYWNASYPMLDYGHNNFSTDDDTVIYITNTSLSTFWARGNYWGGGAPNTGPLSNTYYGPGIFQYSPYDANEQEIAPQDNDPTKGGEGGRIADAESDAQDALLRAIEIETDNPAAAMNAYRRIITQLGSSSAAPIAVERLLWMIRNHFEERERDGELDRLSRFYAMLADTSRARGLAWKARRAALWALAAQHRYDEAIRGFEAIIENHDCLADSVFALIDAGTLHLEAREWAERDTGAHVQAIFGNKRELAPASFQEHRKKSDELLALLSATDGGGVRPAIPTEYFLAQNYPNPFNSVTRIRYGLPEDAGVKLRIYDAMGREVITLVNDEQKAGYHSVWWQGSDTNKLPSGAYFYRLEAGSFVRVNKMTLVK